MKLPGITRSRISLTPAWRSGGRQRRDELQCLARALDLIACKSLDADYTIKPIGAARYRLSGTLRAEVEQTCVVTLEPVSSEIKEPFDFEFWPEQDLPAPVAENWICATSRTLSRSSTARFPWGGSCSSVLQRPLIRSPVCQMRSWICRLHRRPLTPQLAQEALSRPSQRSRVGTNPLRLCGADGAIAARRTCGKSGCFAAATGYGRAFCRAPV